MKRNFKKNNKKIKLNKAGFTLIEILIVTVIAGMVFTAVYAFYANVIKFNVEGRYEIIASNLAQEGIEIIRNRRDRNVLRGPSVDWRNGLPDRTCYPLSPADGGPGCPTTGSSSVSLGGHSFERNCRITTVNGDDMRVVCTVVWNSIAKSGQRSAEATSILTNWYEFTP